MRHLTARLLAPAAATLVALTGIVVAGPPAGAACPVTGCDGGGTTYTYTAQLSVSRTAGTVTSTTVDGHQISCGSTCSVSDSQTVADPGWPADGWPTYTLSASDGPAGYSPTWTGCGTAPTCDVVNDQVAKTVALTWVDVTPPTVAFSPPARVGAFATLSAWGSDAAGVVSLRWYVDGSDQGLFVPAAGLSLAPFADGPHTVGVRARDAAGNESSLAQGTVEIDRAVHQVVSTTPDYVKAAPELTFSTTDSDVVTFACSVDDAAFSPCTSPWTPVVGEGSHRVMVRATDDLGNIAQQTRSFVVDQTPPALSLTDAPFEGASFEQSTTSLTPQQVEEHPDTFACTLDAAPVTCAAGSPVAITGLAVGDHDFRVTATDRAGNVASLVRHFSRVAPSRRTPTAVMTAPSRLTAGRRATVRLSLAGSAGQVTGAVTWKVGSKVVCRTTLASGRASCRTPRLRPGRQVVVATYAGSASYLPVSTRRTIRVHR